MRFINFFLLLLFVSANPACELIERQVKVNYRGALRNFMHGNDLSAKLDLDTLRDRPYLYGLGARENLKGEILIWSGEPVVSLVRDSQVLVDHSFDHRAALFVWSEVEKWEAFAVPDTVNTYSSLEAFIAHQAAGNSLWSLSAPFPFRLRGEATLDWHVIDWPPDDSVHTHEKHRTSGPHGTLQNQKVEVLGFYSTEHTGIFTHHTTNMHLHFRTLDNTLAGHVDDLAPRQMVLYLPAFGPE